MRRTKSSIDQLPPEARETLEAMLADPYNGLTYRDMAEAIEADWGIRLSKSAIHRYGQRYNRELERIKPVAESMKRIEAYMREHSPADLSAQILALVQDGLLRRILDGQEDIDEIPIADAIRMSLQAQRVSTSVYRYRDQTIERCEADEGAAAEAHMAWLRQALRSNPGLLEEIAKESREDELVCGTGGDGRRGGREGAAEPTELPGDAAEEDHAGAEKREDAGHGAGDTAGVCVR